MPVSCKGQPSAFSNAIPPFSNQTSPTPFVKQSTGHTHTGHTDRENTPDTGTHTRTTRKQKPTNTSHKHLTTLEGGATTVRATSHARVGGRAEVSMRGRVEVRRGLGRARVRRAPAGPLRSIQLEASRGHEGDATPATLLSDSSTAPCLQPNPTAAPSLNPTGFTLTQGVAAL